MNTRTLTASRLPIARRCRWALREDVEYPIAPNLYDKEGGNRIHDAFSSYIDSKCFPPLDFEQGMAADQMKRLWGDRVNTDAWSSEVAFALHPANGTARLLGRHINRDYRLESGEIGVTVDYLGQEGEHIVVGDWKPPFDPHVEAVEENLQLLAGAAAASFALGKDGCVIELARVSEDSARIEPYIATPLVLMRACVEIAEIQATIAGAPAVAGDHCAYCPALGGCPETQRIVNGALPGAAAVWSTGYVSDENDAILVDELAALKKILESVEKGVKERAGQRGGIMLRDGKVYKATLSSRSGLKAELVKQILGDRYAECVVRTGFESFRRVNPT